jgi:DNA replication initiation complex subunit (GINS family)
MTDYYSRLLEWRRAESTARGLAKIPPDFYSASQAYLADLRKTFEEELRQNPGGRKGEVARQTFHRASQVARDIVEARMTKILSSAFQASVGGSRELGPVLSEERVLHDELLRALSQHRTAVAPFLAATNASPAPPASAPLTPLTPGRTEAKPVPPVATPSADRALPPAAMVFIRILKDQRPIETHGETLDLRKEDVLSVPPDVARMLIAGKVAEPVGPAKPATTT